MGFLHEGHLTLLREGRKLGDELVLSIFVNPTQFGPSEDFETYPRDMERDLELAEKEGVNTVFTPTPEELYGENFQTYVNLENLPHHLCGLSRPAFFRGVATVVSKLFNIVKPHAAIFGQKDFQQLAVIRQMVKDLNFDIEIIGVPTVREPDGLAMSSRNAYLSKEERPVALSLYQSLQKAKTDIQSGQTDANRILADASGLIESHEGTAIDYIKICDPETLDDIKVITGPVLMALAVNVGQTRLIDNVVIDPEQ